MTGNLLSTPPPLAPPKTAGSMISWLRLIRSHRVGISTFFRLMEEHGSAQAALEALPDIANKAGVAKYRCCTVDMAERELALGRKIGARILPYGAPNYPASLYDLPDPPPVLWTLGQQELLNKPAIALVGARNSSSLGGRMAKSLAGDLSKAGFVIVSGLARGIDTAAHHASLETGTIAVQAGGVDQVYPAENAKLHDQIAEHGLRISEQPLGMTPKARDFPKRNRIISGLSQAVIVVEAAAKSGSLITARNALDQGRDVLVVPGHPLDGRSSGCNMLIRDGATLVRNANDVMEAVARIEPETQPQPELDLEPTPTHTAMDAHAQILGLLGPTPVAEDQLIRDTGLPAQSVVPFLTSLELDGKIIRQPGGLLTKAT